jgi:hypothetical protein
MRKPPPVERHTEVVAKHSGILNPRPSRPGGRLRTRGSAPPNVRICITSMSHTPQNPSAGVRPAIGVELPLATRPSILAGGSSVT